MGQRLIINIYNDTELLANAYYHWSAYTADSIELTKDIINFLLDTKNVRLSKLEQAVAALAYTGANLCSQKDMTEYFNNMSNYNEIRKLYIRYGRRDLNRSRGLIYIDPDQMKDSNDISEYSIDIDLSDNTVDFDVYFYVSRTTNEDSTEEGSYSYYLAKYQDKVKKFNQTQFSGIPFNSFLDFEDIIWNYKKEILHDTENNIVFLPID